MLPGATYFCFFFVGVRMQLEVHVCFIRWRWNSIIKIGLIVYLSLIDWKNEPVSQYSSNMLSVAPKEFAVLSIKYQYFLTLPGLAIAVSLSLTLYSKLVLNNGLMSWRSPQRQKTCTRPVLTQVTKQEVRQALRLTRPRWGFRKLEVLAGGS